MNNFILESAAKTYFGKGCVKEYLACLVSQYGKNVLFAYGGGSINFRKVLYRNTYNFLAVLLCHIFLFKAEII